MAYKFPIDLLSSGSKATSYRVSHDSSAATRPISPTFFKECDKEYNIESLVIELEDIHTLFLSGKLNPDTFLEGYIDFYALNNRFLTRSILLLKNALKLQVNFLRYPITSEELKLNNKLFSQVITTFIALIKYGQKNPYDCASISNVTILKDAIKNWLNNFSLPHTDFFNAKLNFETLNLTYKLSEEINSFVKNIETESKSQAELHRRNYVSPAY